MSPQSLYRPQLPPSYIFLPSKRNYLVYLFFIDFWLIPFFLMFEFEQFYFEYILLFIIGILITGAASMLYTYLNFNDYKDLTQATHGSELRCKDPGLMLLLYFVFPYIVPYFKYQQLHDHLKDHHKEHKIPPSGKVASVLIIGSFLVCIILVDSWSFEPIIFLLPFSIWAYLEYKWQDTLNIHIDNHILFSIRSYQEITSTLM